MSTWRPSGRQWAVIWVGALLSLLLWVAGGGRSDDALLLRRLATGVFVVAVLILWQFDRPSNWRRIPPAPLQDADIIAEIRELRAELDALRPALEEWAGKTLYPLTASAVRSVDEVQGIHDLLVEIRDELREIRYAERTRSPG